MHFPGIDYERETELEIASTSFSVVNFRGNGRRFRGYYDRRKNFSLDVCCDRMVAGLYS
jgi:hypothetical protein